MSRAELRNIFLASSRNVMSFSTFDADKTLQFVDHGHVHNYNMPTGAKISIAEFDAGWSWEHCVKPLAGTNSCQVQHMGYCVKGSMHIVPDDGTPFTICEGQVYFIKPYHQAHTETCTVLLDFASPLSD